MPANVRLALENGAGILNLEGGLGEGILLQSGYYTAPRELIWRVLFTKLASLPQFKAVSRRGILNESTNAQPPALQPAIWLMEGDETRARAPGSRANAPIKTLSAEIWIWARLPDASGGNGPYAPDQVTPGASVLNPLLDAIDALLETPDDRANMTNTLGGIVQHCWAEGRGVKVPGDFDPTGQCFASVPIKILWPS